MSQSDRPRWSGVFAIGVTAGLLTGLGQVGLTVAGQIGFDQISGLGPQMIWMTPIGCVLGFSVVAGLLVAGGWSWDRIRSTPIIVGVFTALAVLNLSLFVPSLHLVSDVMISAGMGALAARIVRGREQKVMRLARLAGSAGVVGILVVAILMSGSRALQEQKEIAALPVARTGTPNVLLLSLDTVRRESCSFYGYPQPTTPVLERWSQRGTVFRHAVATAPWTLPSHASVFTGRMPHETSVDWSTPLDNTWPVLAGVMKDYGYVTAGFVANLSYMGVQYGLGRDFIHYEDFPANLGETIVSSKLLREIVNSRVARRLSGYDDFIARKDALEVNEDFLQWLDDQDRTRPFFAFLNYFDAHEPYLPPAEFDSKFASRVSRRNDLIVHNLHQGERAEKAAMTEGERKREREAYEASIAFIDASLGELFDGLTERGILQNTVVIVFSDHGEMFGEHGKFTHGNSLYREALEVPLLMFGPGVLAGHSVERPVSLADLPATVLDLTGIQDDRMPGMSLAGLSEESASRPAVSELYGQGKWRASLIADKMHLIWVDGDSMRLYDWRNDPREEQDLAARASTSTQARAMLALVDSMGARGPRP